MSVCGLNNESTTESLILHNKSTKTEKATKGFISLNTSQSRGADPAPPGKTCWLQDERQERDRRGLCVTGGGVERFGVGYVDKYVCVFFHSTGLEAQIELGRKLT